MEGIGERIKLARRSGKMTQEELAAALNVSRAAVANWEQGRRQIDDSTMEQLTALFGEGWETKDWTEELKLEAEKEAVAEGGVATAEAAEVLQETAEALKQPEEQTNKAPVIQQPAETQESADLRKAEPAAAEKKGTGKKKIALWAAAAAIVVIAVVLFLIRPWGKKVVYAYTSPVDGVTYTIEKFQERAENVAGQAYLRTDTVLTVFQNSDKDYWMYNVVFKEMNGIAVDVERVETIYIYKSGALAEYNQTAEDLKQFGMDMHIPANGEWTFTGGQPVQDAAVGVGTILRGTDENGASLVVTAYIPFNT